MDLGIAGNTAVITASSAGLGRACAASFAKEDANVVVCGRSPDRLEAARTALAGLGDGTVLTVQADVTRRGGVSDLFENAVDAFGGVDHLVVSSPDPNDGTFLDVSMEDWRDGYEKIVGLTVLATAEAYPHLRESDAGSIVYITSPSVREAADHHVLSTSLRRAVWGLTKTTAREFAPDVRVNAVRPANVYTDPLSPSMERTLEERRRRRGYDTTDEVLADLAASVPLDRTATGEDLGDVVAFLASERAGYITGASVPVEGGKLRS